jgi:hypothetical protein
MLKLKLILEEGDHYSGPSDSKMTSISGDVAKPITWLQSTGQFGRPDSTTIIDYGCGKAARNAAHLRTLGYKVYSYDLYWGVEGVDPYSAISNVLPNDSFDVGFTSYVINVVTIPEQTSILSWMKSHCDRTFHVTRNKDITAMIILGMKKNNSMVIDFFTNEFGGNTEDVERIQNGEKSPELIQIMNDFAKFGLKTSRGFQRIPFLEEYGFTLMKQSTGYKIYKS